MTDAINRFVTGLLFGLGLIFAVWIANHFFHARLCG